MIPSITFTVALLALLAVGETAVTSHSSTEEPSTTTTSSTTLMSTTSDTKSLQSTTPTSKKSALTMSSTTTTTTTKRSVTEELEDTHILGDTTQDDSDEDDSEEIDDEPLPTLAPMLATDLMPPNEDAEVLNSHWNPPPKQTESKVPFGLLVIRIIQIVKPKEQLGNNFSPLKFSQNNYRPMYSSTLPSDSDGTLCSDENDNEGQKSVPTSQSMIPLREDNNEIPFRTFGNTNSYYNAPTTSPFFSRFVPSTWNNRPWYNNFRAFNTFGNYNY